jgi:hypothetical protein
VKEGFKAEVEKVMRELDVKCCEAIGAAARGHR